MDNPMEANYDASRMLLPTNDWPAGMSKAMKELIKDAIVTQVRELSYIGTATYLIHLNIGIYGSQEDVAEVIESMAAATASFPRELAEIQEISARVDNFDRWASEVICRTAPTPRWQQDLKKLTDESKRQMSQYDKCLKLIHKEQDSGFTKAELNKFLSSMDLARNSGSPSSATLVWLHGWFPCHRHLADCRN